jgi:hypothetical protein
VLLLITRSAVRARPGEPFIQTISCSYANHREVVFSCQIPCRHHVGGWLCVTDQPVRMCRRSAPCRIELSRACEKVHPPPGTVKLTIKPMQTPGKQSSDCRGTFPRRKGALSEHPIVLGTNQVPTQVEQIVNSSMNAQETLRLLHRFKTSHAPLSYPRRLV